MVNPFSGSKWMVDPGGYTLWILLDPNDDSLWIHVMDPSGSIFFQSDLINLNSAQLSSSLWISFVENSSHSPGAAMGLQFSL